MGFSLAEVWVRSTLLVLREPRIQVCFHEAVPTQPIMQERTFKSLFQKIGQAELKHFLAEMQLNVDLSDCRGSVPGSNFRDAAEKRPSTSFCFSLPSSEKEGKATRLRDLHQGKNPRLLPWKSCIQQLKPSMAENVSAGSSAGPRIALGEAEGAAACRWDEQKEEPWLLQTRMCLIRSSFQTQVRTDCRGTQWQNLLSILILRLDLSENEDNDFKRHHHKSVSLFGCIFFFSQGLKLDIFNQFYFSCYTVD